MATINDINSGLNKIEQELGNAKNQYHTIITPEEIEFGIEQSYKVIENRGHLTNYWNRVNYYSRPHPIRNKKRYDYYALEFADTFLPYTRELKGRGLWMYDGAEIFDGVKKAEMKLFKFDDHKYLISVIGYSYPKGVLAQKKKNIIVPKENEVLTFFEVDKNNKVDIHFKFGKRFKNHIAEYIKETKSPKSVHDLEEKIYETGLRTVQEYFRNGLVHQSKMQFVLDTLGLDIYNKSEIDKSNNYFIDGYWADENGNKINEAFLGDFVYFILKLDKSIPLGSDIEIFLYDQDREKRISSYYHLLKTGNILGYLFNTGEHSGYGDDLIPITYTDYPYTKNKILVDSHKITIKLELDEEKYINYGKNDFDQLLQLYYKLEYKMGFHKFNKATLPKNSKDYLIVKEKPRTLFIKPAYQSDTGAYTLPELYTNVGKTIIFAIKQINAKDIAEPLIETLTMLKVQTVTTHEFLAGIQSYKKTIYEETINLSVNQPEKAVLYEVDEVQHLFKPEKNFIIVDREDKVIERKRNVKKSDLAAYNPKYEKISIGNHLTAIFSNYFMIEEAMQMIPSLSKDGKRRLPKLSVMTSFIPGGQVLSFGLAVAEWIVENQWKEIEETLDELFWVQWENTKPKGIKAVLEFLNSAIAQKKRFTATKATKQMVSDLIKGKIKTLEELKSLEQKANAEDLIYTIITYEIEGKTETIDLVESVYINDSNFQLI